MMPESVDESMLSLSGVGRFLENMAALSDHVYWLSSPDFKKIQYISPSYETIWGRPRSALYATPEIWITFLHPDDAKKRHPIHEMANKVALFGKHARFAEQYRIVRPDGEVRWILDNGFPIFDTEGRCCGVTGIALDITQEKQHALELQKAKKTAEVADRAKSEFIANMSHDLRTPMSGIIGLSTLIEEQSTQPEIKRYAHLIHHASHELLTLLNAVLDTIKQNSLLTTRIMKDTFQLRDLLDDIVRLELPTLELKQLAFKMKCAEDIPAEITCDRQKLHRILLNLLGNAIKFTEKGHITLTIYKKNDTAQKTTLCFEIEDTGIGIPEDAQSKVFRRFYRANPSYLGTYEGYGLGLHTAKRFTAALKGKISLTSTLGLGSCFTIEIPVGVQQTQSNIKHPVPKKELPNDISIYQGMRPERILLIEDNPIAAMLATQMISAAGYVSVHAITGEQALALVKQQSFDYIISDIGLPGMSGHEFAACLRQWEKDRLLSAHPLIGLTAHLRDEQQKSALDAGMNAVFEKPLTPEMLKNILKKTLFPQNITEIPQTPGDRSKVALYPLLDEQTGIQFVGDKQVLASIIPSIIENIRDHELPALIHAHHNENWEKIAAIAHKIKSSAVYSGTLRMQHACAMVEMQVREKDNKRYTENYAQLITVIHDTLHALEMWMEALDKIPEDLILQAT